MELSPTGARIAHLLRASGRKAKPFSKLCGLGEPHIGMILRGEIQNPDQKTCQKIADATGCSFVWLLLGQGDPPADEVVRATLDARESGAAVDEPAVVAHTANDFAVSNTPEFQREERTSIVGAGV